MAKDPRLGAYMIGVVSMRYGVHPQTLRLYEREGLLTPSRTEGKTRLYSDEDLERLAHALEAAGVKDVPRPASATGLVKLTPHGLRKRS